MNAKAAAFWHALGETALAACAFVLPLSFYLKTYDPAALKTAVFQWTVLALVLCWKMKSVMRGRFEVASRAVLHLAPAVVLIAAAAARFRTAALSESLSGILGPLAYGVVLLEFAGADEAERFSSWLLRAGWIAALYGAVQKAGLDPLPWSGASTMVRPELFAGFMALCLPLALTRALEPERVWPAKAADLLFAALACASSSACLVSAFAFAVLTQGRAAKFLGLAAVLAARGLHGGVAPVSIDWPLTALCAWSLAAGWRARGLASSGLYAALAAGALCGPKELVWPIAGLVAGLSLLGHGTDQVHVLPLPWGAGRRWLAVPAVAAFAAAAVVPWLWLKSDAEHNLGVYYARRGRWDEALFRFDRVAKGSPDYLPAQYYKGLALLDSGKPAEALAQFAAVEALSPDYRRVNFAEGRAFAQVFDWENAAKRHERQAALDPMDAENLRSLAQAETVRGELGQARRAALRAIALSPHEPANWQALSAVYIKEKNTPASRRLLLEGRKLGLKFDKPGAKR